MGSRVGRLRRLVLMAYGQMVRKGSDVSWKRHARLVMALDAAEGAWN